MATTNLKAETPDATLPSTGYLFGADSQTASKPSVYTVDAVAEAIVETDAFDAKIAEVVGDATTLGDTLGEIEDTLALKAPLNVTQSGTGAVARSLSGKALERLSVTDFGTVGTSNDSAVWALAVAEAVASSRELFIPGNTTVTIDAAGYSSSLRVYGEGASSVIKWRNTTGSADLFDWSGSCNVEFRNLTIDSNRQAHTDNSSYFAAIWFACTNGSRLRLDGVNFINGRIIDVRVNGPTVSGESVEFDMERCRFYDGLVGSSTRSAQFVSLTDGVKSRIVNNRLIQPTKPATYGRAGVVHDGVNRNGTDARGTLVATGNYFENVGRGTADQLGCLDVYYGADDVAFTGNHGKQICGRFLTVKGDLSRASMVGNVVDDVFSSAANSAVAYGILQDLYGTGTNKNLVIADNICGSSDAYGIFIDGDDSGGVDFTNISVSGNVIGACDVAGIHCRNLAGIDLTGNMIDGGLDGITFSAIAGDISINGGRIANCTQHGIHGNAGVGANTSAHVKVSGTRISNITSRAITLSAVASYDIDADIHTAAQGVNVAGTTAHSRIRGKMISVTTPLVRAGSDTVLDWRVESTTAIGFSTRELTIASGAISIFADWHWVDTEADAASDDLDTINGGWEGRIVTLKASNNSRDVVLIDASGNLSLNGNFTMNNAADSITLQYIGSTWYELCRSDNAA